MKLTASALLAVTAHGFVPQIPSARLVQSRKARTSLQAVEVLDSASDLVAFGSAHGLHGIPGWTEAPAWTLADAAAAIEAEVDNGWFGTGLLKGVDPWGTWRGFIQASIVSVHDFLYNQCGIKENTYGFAIMLFTFILRSATLPLTWIQYSSTEKQKALAPIMEEIKEKFPNPEQQNLVIAKLYDDTEVNPLLGCLPSFLQIPVFIALYRSILRLANEDALAEPFFFLPSLEGPTLTEQLQLPQGRGTQWLFENWSGSFAGGDLQPLLGWDDTLAYCAIPLIITITQAVSQKVTAPPMDEDDPSPTLQRTQAILKYIPLMIGFFSLQVPSALCLYWFTSNTFTFAATVSIKNYYAANPPVVDWDFLKEMSKSGGMSAFQLEMPANMEEALADARLSAVPPRASRRLSGAYEPNAAATVPVEAVLTAE